MAAKTTFTRRRGRRRQNQTAVFQALTHSTRFWHGGCVDMGMKPLPPESRPVSPASHSAWLLREIAVVLAIKVVAIAALWWAFFSPSSSGDRPLAADAGRTFLERQPVSPPSPPRSAE